MIEAEDLPFLKNVLSIHNATVDIDLLTSIITATKHNQHLTEDILDSFGKNQFKSKGKLLELIDNCNILDKESEVIIFGCWYGSILIPALSPKVKKITGIDLDNAVIKIAKNSFFKNYSNIDYITDNIFSKFRGRYSEAKLFINTSCEHMLPMNVWPWWENLQNDAYFAFQSNNMDQIEGHVNCVQSLEEFKTQLPANFQVLFQDELKDERGTRYTLVGKITPA